jgi:hypothetical protein
MPQLKIWHFLVIGIERNVCRCAFNRCSVITQFAKLAAGEQLCGRWIIIENYSTSKFLEISLEKSHFMCCDTFVANDRYIHQFYTPDVCLNYFDSVVLQKLNVLILCYCLESI